MEQTSIKLVKSLQKAGFEAYWAGGCVRDMLMGQEPQDFDIVTSAKPEDIEKIVSHTIPVGKQFGVIIAVQNGHHFEIATFRSDSSYSDGRRPDAVIFTTAAQDAKRRDFSINALFYDPLKKQIYDYVDGQKDLKAGLIRFIGDPHQRILEDHLRLMRAVRFKNTFNFQYHPDTYHALQTHAELSNKVSKERLRDELNKMMLSDNNIHAFNDMEDLGILKVILPEFQAMKGVPQPQEYHHEGDVFDHSLKALQSLPRDASLTLRLATVMHDIGKPETFALKERIRFDQHAEHSAKIAKNILNRLAFPAIYIKRICWLIQHHMMMTQLLEMPTGRQRHWYLHEEFPDLLELFKADIAGTTPSDYSLYKRIERSYRYAMKKIPKEPKKLLSGEDVMKKLKIPAGKKIGEILEKLREEQLAGKIKTKDQAVIWITSNFQ